MESDQHSNIIVKEMIAQRPPIEVWNMATEFAIEVVREVLREEGSSLTDEASSDLQRRLHQQMLHP